jgi:hypothetical protein
MALGALGLVIAALMPKLRRLNHLARPQASCTHTEAFDAPVDHRPDGLKIRLEAAWADVMRVADLPADNGTFTAEFTSFCHHSP